MPAYYNENDAFCVQWLRNLISANLIAPGDVDDRSIESVRPADLAPYTQCHFFAGIGGWSLALRLAGIPDDFPVWTGSPPCQDVSVAGAVWNVRSGLTGNRTSLVERWLDLVETVRPRALCFENVPGIAPWLDQITRRMASLGYTISQRKRSTQDIAGPHLRRRVWVVANRDGARWEKSGPRRSSEIVSDPRRTPPRNVWVASARRTCGLDDGLPTRASAVRAYGNAIDPWVAAEVIGECL